MMRRTLTAALCGAALIATPLGIAGVANADSTEPALTVVPAVACGTVTLTATSTSGSYEVAVFSGPNAGDSDAQFEGQFRVGPDAPTTRTFRLDQGAYAGSAFTSWATISGPEQDFYVSGAVGVDTDCPGPGGNPPITPTPTVTELCDAATLDAAAELLAGAALNADLDVLGDLLSLDADGEVVAGFKSGVALAGVRDALACDDTTDAGTGGDGQDGSTDGTTGTDEFDCAGFPLADGRTAQDVLNADPADPNRLDLDRDGQACDLDDTDPAVDEGGDFDQVGAGSVPRGGVATGG